ncbi:MAG: carboxypeptidase-like regulatory domain-containing protein, partial [Bryobacteraceae bacterium]
MKPAYGHVTVSLSISAALLALTAFAAIGAEPSGSLVGSVDDPSGRPVVGANIQARNIATNQTRQTQTTADGSYWITFLPPGNYDVQVSTAGFETAVSPAIRVEVNQTFRANFHLVLGRVEQHIIVSDEVQPIRSDDSTIGFTVGERSINQLPLNERNFVTFSLLVPGAQLPPDGSQNSVYGLTVSVNGAREQENNFLLDGTDNNDQSINGYSALPSVDAIREFQVQGADSSAEYGRNGGAQINVVLKSGTNQIHGDAFEFLRNRHMDAKNFFDLPACHSGPPSAACGSIPRLDRSQFGGTLGGPIVKDKTFFFVSAEGLILHQAVTRTATVPSMAERADALNTIPAALQNPAGLAVLNLYPAANIGSDLATSTEYLAQPVQHETSYQPLIKIDQQISLRDTLAFHYSLSDSSTFYPYDPFYAFTNLPGYGTNYPDRGQNTGLSWIHIFNPHTVNELRPGYNRFSGGITQQDAGQNFSAPLGFPSLAQAPIDQGYPDVVLAGFDGIGDPVNAPQHRSDNTIQLADTLAWNPTFWGGRHQIKVGFDLRDIRLNFFLDPIARGEWQFTGAFTQNPLEDLLL